MTIYTCKCNNCHANYEVTTSNLIAVNHCIQCGELASFDIAIREEDNE